MRQNLDDSYYTFVWSLLAQQPSVRIGVLPEGQSAQVYVPPQPRVSKKGKNAQDDDSQKGSPTAPDTLDLIPGATYCPLSDLIQQYGKRLRIAVDSETCFVAITGSHARVIVSSFEDCPLPDDFLPARQVNSNGVCRFTVGFPLKGVGYQCP